MLTKTNLVQITSTAHGTGAVTTGTFSPSANSLLVVRATAMENADTGQEGTDLTISDSVDGSTGWTSQVVSTTSPGWSYGTRVWTKSIGSNAAPYASMSVSCDAGAFDIYAWRVEVYGFTTDSTRNTIRVGGTGFATDADGNNYAEVILSTVPTPNSYVMGFACVAGTGAGTMTVAQGASFVEDYDIEVASWTAIQAQYNTGTRSGVVSWADLQTGTRTTTGAVLIGIEIAEDVPSERPLFVQSFGRRRTRYAI